MYLRVILYSPSFLVVYDFFSASEKNCHEFLLAPTLHISSNKRRKLKTFEAPTFISSSSSSRIRRRNWSFETNLGSSGWLCIGREVKGFSSPKLVPIELFCPSSRREMPTLINHYLNFAIVVQKIATTY